MEAQILLLKQLVNNFNRPNNLRKKKIGKVKKRKILTTKVVFPIWQSPNRLILRFTKSESESYQPSCPSTSSSAGAGVEEESCRGNLRYRRGGFPTEQTRILFQMNWKKRPIMDTLWSTLHRTSAGTIFRQSWVIFSVVLWMILTMRKKNKKQKSFWYSHRFVFRLLCFGGFLFISCLFGFGPIS